MNNIGLLLIPTIKHSTSQITPFEYVNAKGKQVKENVITAEMDFIWIDADSGDKLEVPFILVGRQQDSSQALGSALTYCNRYFLLKFFQIATNEADQTSGEVNNKVKKILKIINKRRKKKKTNSLNRVEELLNVKNINKVNFNDWIVKTFNRKLDVLTEPELKKVLETLKKK